MITSAIAQPRRTVAVLALVLAAAAGNEPKALDSVLTLVTSGEAGQRLTIDGQVADGSGRSIPGARLHVYQTDASGRYTPERPMDEAHARLSGWVRSDARGRFELRTIRPGGYAKALRLGDRDRKIPAHIHIDVDAEGYAARKVQVVFADDPLLSDPYWQDWVREGRQPVLSVSRGGDVQTAKLVVSLQGAGPARPPRTGS